MKVELTADTAKWVNDALATGRFSSAEDAIRYAVERMKLSELRAALESAEAEGGAFDTNEVRRFVRERIAGEKRNSDL